MFYTVLVLHGANALAWCLDPKTVWLADGDEDLYTPELLNKMYAYQDAHGKLCSIETLENDNWPPVGDVRLSLDDFAIVIGEKNCRGKGLGRAVVSALADRVRQRLAILPEALPGDGHRPSAGR